MLSGYRPPSLAIVTLAALSAVAASSHDSADAGLALEHFDDFVLTSKPTAVAVSPDGAFVYTADSFGQIQVAERDLATGAFGALVEIEDDGLCVEGPVGTVCREDADCGGGTSACNRPDKTDYRVAMRSDGTCFYSISEDNHGVFSYDRNPVDGTLDLVGFVGHDTCTAGRPGARCDTNADCDSTGGAGDGICLTFGLERPQGIAISPDGLSLYILGGRDTIMALAPSGGCNLVPFQLLSWGVDLDFFNGPMDVAVSPDGLNVYVAVKSGALHQFTRDLSGHLTPSHIFLAGVCTVGDVGDDCDGNSDCKPVGGGSGVCTFNAETLLRARAVAVSPDGEHVYASGDGLPVFKRDTTDPTTPLTLIDTGDTSAFSLEIGRKVAFSNDGSALYFGSSGSDLLVLFTRDAATGLLRPEHAQGPTNALDIAVSPDDASIYVVGANPAEAYRLAPTLECSAATLPGCREPVEPAAASLLIIDKTNERADSVKWKWKAGEATPFASLGAPAATTSYAACLYDKSGAGGTDALVHAARVGAGGACKAGGSSRPCWKEGNNRFKFKDRGGIPSGVRKLSLKASEIAGKPSIQVQSKGPAVELPALPLSLPATFQMQNSDGECWQAEYGAASRNESGLFKAGSD